jgi:predicted Zn-dependent protease
MSQANEIRLGEKYYDETLANQGGYLGSDQQAARYVDEVGQKLAAVSERPDLPYEFAIINSSEPHAWALPGGKIGVTRGLLAELESEAELAAVLGHQIGHLAARDGAKAVELDILKDVAVTTVAIGATFFGIPVIAAVPFLLRTGPTGDWLAQRSHSDKDEVEADREAMEYMQAAGYDVHAATELLTRMATRTPVDSAVNRAHPISRKRLANAHMAVFRGDENDRVVGERNLERFQRETAGVRRSQKAYSEYDAGVVAYESGDYDAALAFAQSAIETVPEEALFYQLEGDVWMATEHYEAALASYDRSVEFDPNYAPAYLRRASARRALGDHGGAQQDFATSYLLSPDEQVQRQLGPARSNFDNDPFFQQFDHEPGYYRGHRWPRRGR